MNKKLQVWTPLLFSLAMVAGIFIGFRLKEAMPGKSFFSIDKRDPLQEVLNLIENKYVDTINVNKLSDTAIDIILKSLDPHSAYIPASEVEDINNDIAGSFFGVGIEFSIIDDTLNVLTVLPDGPAAKAGIKIGDKFLAVNNTGIAGVKISEDAIRKLLHGQKDSDIKVTVFRDSQKQVITITRGMIAMNSIDAAYMIQDSIGYIKLGKFTEVCYREFMQTMEGLQKKGLKKLILDLRDNGGGVLDQAVEIADEFLDGDKLITYTEGSHFPKKEYRCKRPGLFETGSLVVLADEGTASASEVLIGALQDWDRATIIGRRTFGKGLVQEQYDLSDGSALRLTVARYFTPVGRSIQRPYTNGRKAYFDEINHRFTDGETLTADSIKNDTTKLFKTVGGRKVYGGGGITPDIFVSMDTAGYNGWDKKLYTKGTLENFGYHYYLSNEQALKKYKTSQDFVSGFSLSDNDWSYFTTIAAKDSISLNWITPKSKTLLQQELKSYIAHEIWRNEGFFETMNVTDEAVLKALEVLKK
ncbi:S41 family peptidase [Ferruginibacter albus]|uniref:S41 family peptidase n=1 Tax=Ferruginibacter albus TaxID=2875540 RepID=UPI001CC7FE78|nr:S41 family peptidase [Ferruginibacter albus]UAY53486.1 S41 family peptidase [Ferruginibacter albus]